MKYLILFLFISIRWGQAEDIPKVNDYGENLLETKFLPSTVAHQFVLGNVIDSAFEEVISYGYIFYYPFKFVTLGAEAIYNEIESKNIFDKSEDLEIRSSIPKNQYGIVFNFPFAQNYMNFLNWKYFQFKIDFEVAFGQSISTQQQSDSYFSYGVKFESKKLFSQFSLVLGLRNTIIAPDGANIAFNSAYMGLKYLLE